MNHRQEQLTIALAQLLASGFASVAAERNGDDDTGRDLLSMCDAAAVSLRAVCAAYGHDREPDAPHRRPCWRCGEDKKL
jgi:hypothetical protein